jgi:hypothetical protein
LNPPICLKCNLKRKRINDGTIVNPIRKKEASPRDFEDPPNMIITMMGITIISKMTKKIQKSLVKKRVNKRNIINVNGADTELRTFLPPPPTSPIKTRKQIPDIITVKTPIP